MFNERVSKITVLGKGCFVKDIFYLRQWFVISLGIIIGKHLSDWVGMGLPLSFKRFFTVVIILGYLYILRKYIFRGIGLDMENLPIDINDEDFNLYVNVDNRGRVPLFVKYTVERKEPHIYVFKGKASTPFRWFVNAKQGGVCFRSISEVILEYNLGEDEDPGFTARFIEIYEAGKDKEQLCVLK